jgi:glycosyltransferase involved in cell wall biosynthesis
MHATERAVLPEESFGIVAGSEIPFPPSLAVGEGTPLLVGGWCRPTENDASIREIEIAVDGHRTEPMSYGLPRKDVYREAVAAGLTGRAARNAFRSGFLAVAEVPPRAAGRTVPVEVVATSHSGVETSWEIGRLPLEPNPRAGEDVSWPADGSGPRVAICMATYSPDPEMLSQQIASLKAQTHRNWICFISDDEATPESKAQIESAIGDDPRFRVSPAPRRMGFYSNFERALELVPDSADLIALADQDDYWREDKLEVLIEAVSPADTTLAYSDARIVDDRGELLHASYWMRGRRNNHTNLASLIIANTVTGAACIFKPEVLRLALPFPHTPVNCFHDHWIACVALAIGDVAYVDEPLYDYVQHGDAVIGFEIATSRGDQKRARPLRSLLTTIRDTYSSSSTRSSAIAARRLFPMNYYFGSTRLTVLASAVRIRCQGRLAAGKLRGVRRLETADQNTISFLALLLRRFRRYVGLNETNDVERTRIKGLLWRRVIQGRARFRRDPEGMTSDARIPLLEEARPGEAARL